MADSQTALISEPWVDLAFRVLGERVPIDHGYALYAALSKTLPALHGDIEFGTLPSWDFPSWLHVYRTTSVSREIVEQ